MNKNIRFYVMHNSKTGDVEFVDASRGIRMKELLLNGFVNIGGGECKDVSELNRGICNNMRGLYEYQKRQNDELKVQLERALQKLKEVHRISNTSSRVQIREQHVLFEGKQYNNIDSLPLRERIEANKGPRFGYIMPLVKELWEDVN